MGTSKNIPYGVMIGVRVRSAVDRSILGLSPRLSEVATGFSGGGLIGSTHATQRVARRFTRPRPPSFQDKRSGACCRRGSSFRFCTARGRCRWCARARLPCRSFDHRTHDALSELFLDLIAAIGLKSRIHRRNYRNLKLRQKFEDVLDTSNTASDVWADSVSCTLASLTT